MCRTGAPESVGGSSRADVPDRCPREGLGECLVLTPSLGLSPGAGVLGSEQEESSVDDKTTDQQYSTSPPIHYLPQLGKFTWLDPSEGARIAGWKQQVSHRESELQARTDQVPAVYELQARTDQVPAVYGTRRFGAVGQVLCLSLAPRGPKRGGCPASDRLRCPWVPAPRESMLVLCSQPFSPPPSPCRKT